MSCGIPSGGSRKYKKGGDEDEPTATPQIDTTPEEVDDTSAENPQEVGGRRIIRKGYTRKSGVHVRASKVRDMGAPGKWSAKHGPGIGELKPGGLMGYSPSMSKTARHSKLRKVVKSKGALSTFRKLNALATYTKRTAKGKSKTAKADRNWVKKTYMK
jgi:hypothetical protein